MPHFPPPKYSNWGFNSPSPDLMKADIDLRPPHAKWSMFASSPRTDISETSSGQLDLPPSRSKDIEKVPNLLLFPKKDNQKPGSSREGLFGRDDREEFFAGPIFKRFALSWRDGSYARSTGDVFGARENHISLPFNEDVIARSACVMSTGHDSQSGVWIGPRHILSTLHFYPWIHNLPSHSICDEFRQRGVAFAVENEISQEIIDEYSPRVRLVGFDIDNDIGIFKLEDNYSDQTDFIDYQWIIERDEICQHDSHIESEAMCVDHEDVTMITILLQSMSLDQEQGSRMDTTSQ